MYTGTPSPGVPATLAQVWTSSTFLSPARARWAPESLRSSAASGRRVSLYDAAPGATERGLAAMRKNLERLAEKGGSDPDEVVARVGAVEELVAADLLIEAVIEDAAVKEELFRRADEVLPEAPCSHRTPPRSRSHPWPP